MNINQNNQQFLKSENCEKNCSAFDPLDCEVARCEDPRSNEVVDECKCPLCHSQDRSPE